MTNLAGIVQAQAAQAGQGERPAVRQGSQGLTYAELARGSGQAAALLREAGVGPGDPVALMMPNVLAFPLFFYGALRAGGVVVPMNPLLKGREVAHYLGDSGARLILAWDAAAGEAAKGAADRGVPVIRVTEPGAQTLLGDRTPPGDWAERADDDDAVILYTSGTTGHPEGGRADPRQPAPQRRGRPRRRCSALGPDDVVMGCLPLFHSFGQTCGLNAAVAGRRLPDPDPPVRARRGAGDDRQRDRVTVFEGVPTMYAALLHHPGRDRGRHVVAAAVRVRRRGAAGRGAARVRGGVRLRRSWRATACRRPRRWPRSTIRDRRKPGSIGTARSRAWRCGWSTTRAAEVPPGEVGEIAIRGHNVMKGYWRRPEATAAAIRGRLVPHRRPGPGRRGRLLLHRRPQEGPDHPRRLQRLPAGDRGGALRAPGGASRRR